eukprot:TRINITY_DN2426_c0_g1_i1.p1 TRINITY_DN2426_c0_g1~~TRINITY_DN2426_c0_g1_i1.p1  ORF type:complete len:108 (-),score=34.84 TRINITY_DN2426_c0_g1_i1:66-389(-)
MKKISQIILDSSKNSSRAKMNKSTSENIARDLIESWKQELAQNGKFTIGGFGSFHVKNRKASTRILQVGPRKGDQIQIPSKNTIRFKSGKSLKASVQDYNVKIKSDN